MAGETVVFYIKNFIRNGSNVTTETVMQTIPFSGDPVFNNPKAKNDLGKAGSFEFEIAPTSPYYDSFIQFKTKIRIEYFGVQLFRGRVITVDPRTTGIRTVHCEGSFAFFLDSHQLGTKEETRPKIDVNAYLQQIITQHNQDMHGDTDRMFTLGEVPGQYTNATDAKQRVTIPVDKSSQQFGDTSWNKSMDRLEGLLSEFGGYFRVRYNSNDGSNYLDWYDKYYNATLNAQTIEVAKNLIDLSGSNNVDNLFTAVVPIGKGKNGEDIFISDYWPIVSANHEKVDYILVSELATIPLYSDNELNTDYHRKSDYQNAVSDYGYIWRPVEFENADTPEKLFNYAKDWIKNNYISEITQWSVTAVDLKIVDPSKQYLLCGDIVNLVHPEVSNIYRGLTIISAEYDFYNPKNNKYTIGIPHQEINGSYGVKNKSKGKGGGGPISNQNNGSDPTEEEKRIAELRTQLQHDYYFKQTDGRDITLDNPLAFTIYTTDITQKEKKQSVEEFIDAASKLSETKRNNYATLLAEAQRRGVSVDDTQLLIDYTPSVKRQQTRFKNQAADFLLNTVGLNHQQVNVLLNETASQSYFANLVDDNGNWTDFALRQGATIWNNSESIREQAFNTRVILSGGKLPNTTIDTVSNVANQFKDLLAGKKLNVGNTLDVDNVVDSVTGFVTKTAELLNGNVQFKMEEVAATVGQGSWNQLNLDFLGVFTANNTEEDGKEFEIESDTAHIDGVDGTAQFGRDSNWEWLCKVNDTITYVDDQGVTRTSPGFMNAMDFHTREIPSFKTKFAAIDTLVANKATIGELNAAVARIASLETDKLTTTQLKAAIAQITSSLIVNHGMVIGGVVQSSGPIYASDFYFGTPDGSRSLKHCLLGGKVELVSGTTDTYHIVGYDGDGNEVTFSGTFSRAGGPSIGSAGWSDGVYSVKDTNDVVLVSTALQALLPTGATTVSGKVVSRDFYVLYGPDEDHMYSTGFTCPVSIDASDVFDDGVADAGLEVDTTNKQVKRVASSNIKAVSITADASITYDSQTHKYTAGAQSKAGTHLMQYQSIESGLEAYDDGYNTGWNDGGKASYVAYQSGASVPSGMTPTELAYNTNYKMYARYNDSGGTARDASGNANAVRYFKTKPDRYDTGVSDGATAAGLELDTTNKKVKRVASSNVKEYSITAEASITYNSQTHKYTAGAQSKAGTANMQYQSRESGLEAYNDGYDANNSAWLYEQNTGNSAGNLNPGIWVTAGYRDHNNGVHYCGTKWRTLEVGGVREHTGTEPSGLIPLGYNKVYEVYYDNGNGGTPGSGKYFKTPAAAAAVTLSEICTLIASAGGPGPVRAKYKLSNGTKGVVTTRGLSQAQWDSY